MQLTFTAWVESITDVTTVGRKHTDPVKNMNLCYFMNFFPLFAI